MKKYILFLNTAALMVVAAMMASCGKDGPDTSGYTIYVSGQYLGDDDYVGCYWKDSKRVDIPDRVANYGESDIFVSNGDVYLTGLRDISNNPNEKILIPCYWKNGVRTDLDISGCRSGYAKRITVVNGKVYTSGEVVKATGAAWHQYETIPCYWINSERIDAAGDFFVGNDVYAYGTYDVEGIEPGEYPSPYLSPHACYWKNGVRTEILNSSPNYSLTKWRKMSSTPASIFVDNGKVYVAGINEYMPEDVSQITYETWYWVDGKMTIVETSKEWIGIKNIFVEKGIVYLHGRDESYEDCFWKDGSKTKGCGGSGLYVKDGIVFTTGARLEGSGFNAKLYPSYWVNTKRVELPAPVKDYRSNNWGDYIFVE